MKTVKYIDIPEDVKYTLHYCVVNFVILNKRLVELKAKNFNRIEPDDPDYEEFRFLDRNMYHYLFMVKKIKNFKGEKGYHGKTGQDQARLYCFKNYAMFYQKLNITE